METCKLWCRRPAIAVTACFEYSRSKYTFKRPFIFYHRFSIDPRKSYKATNLAFNRQILQFVPYFSNLSMLCINPCVFSVTFNHVFFTKARLAHALLSISGVICSAAIVRQTKEQNKMVKQKQTGRRIGLYFLCYYIIRSRTSHIVLLNYF